MVSKNKMPRTPRGAGFRAGLRARMASLAAIVALLLGAGAVRAAAQDIKADVDYNTEISQTDMHPITYKYSGENKPIKDPGTDFFHFYYTGTVNPDGRMDPGAKIERIALSNRDWDRNRNWIISKLTLFYQIKNNQTPTALRELGGTIPGQAPAVGNLGGAGGQLGGGAGAFTADLAPGATVAVPPTPEQQAANGGAGGNSLLGPPGTGIPGTGAATTLDARAAAEWTFYYDQLVLWQYYCTRVLINAGTDALIDDRGPATALAGGAATNAAGAPGGIQPALGRGGPIGGVGAGAGAGNRIGAVATGFGTPGGGPGFGTPGGGSTGFGGPPGSLGAAVGLLGGAAGGNTMVTAREEFSPVQDYNDPTRVLRYRSKFMDAAKTLDEDIHKRYATMLDEIQKRAQDNVAYQDWINAKRADVLKFAEDWQNVENGKTMMVDHTLFMVTPQAMDVPPQNAINIVDTGRVTPQDLLNTDGTIKVPAR